MSKEHWIYTYKLWIVATSFASPKNCRFSAVILETNERYERKLASTIRALQIEKNYLQIVEPLMLCNARK